jgi:hypothetical protein
MTDPKKDDYVFPFSGAKLNRQQAKQVGGTILCGSIAAVLLALTVRNFSPLLAKVLVVCAAVLPFVDLRRRRKKS